MKRPIPLSATSFPSELTATPTAGKARAAIPSRRTLKARTNTMSCCAKAGASFGADALEV